MRSRGLLVALLISTFANVVLLGSRAFDSIQAGLAVSLVDQFFELEARSRAEPAKALEYADYVRGHYVSGTVLQSGSSYDRMVEATRSHVIADLERIHSMYGGTGE